MERLIPLAEQVQNNPPDLVPQEGVIVREILQLLKPHIDAGVLAVEEVSYAPGRSNLILTYAGSHPTHTVSLVGSHLDVVPVNREEWTREPFKMTREGDLIFGRGSTDCLGHVALITDFFCQLAEKRPPLGPSVVACFIASEENSSIPNIGVDQLVREGRLEHIKNGPVLWIDAADSQPCMGTAGALVWHLTVHGKKCHSGMPSQGINPLSSGRTRSSRCRASTARSPRTRKARRYSLPSTMKPRRCSPPAGSTRCRPSASSRATCG